MASNQGGSQGGPTLRVGIIGLGGGASAMIPKFARNPSYHVAAAADIDQGQLDAFSSQYEGKTFLSAQELCDSSEVEAIYIATPNQFHTEHVIMALNGGKHVLIEKPMTLNLTDADAMIEAADRNDLRLGVNVKHSFAPRVRKVRDMVRSGELGQLRMLNWWYYNDWLYSPRTVEELTPELGGGVPWRQGPHMFDILRTIGGGMVRSVRAMTGTWDATRPVAGCYSGFLEFDNGAVSNAVYSGNDHFSSREFTHRVDEGDAWPDRPEHAKARRALIQAGDKDTEIAMKRARRFGGSGRAEQESRAQGRPSGWLLGGPFVASFDEGDVRFTTDGLTVYGQTEKYDIPMPTDLDGREGIIDEFYHAVLEGRSPVNDGRWGKATVEVLLSLFQSSRERQEVFLSHQTPTVDLS